MSTTVCCAKCAKPVEIVETQKIGRYLYGPCCIEIVKARKEPIK
jgi:hypothetical protein